MEWGQAYCFYNVLLQLIEHDGDYKWTCDGKRGIAGAMERQMQILNFRGNPIPPEPQLLDNFIELFEPAYEVARKRR